MKKSFLVRIYFVAFVLRLIPILLTRHLGIGLDDMFQYDMLARSIASGHGYRWYAHVDLLRFEPYIKFDLSTAHNYDPQYGLYTSFRAPLYPTFLAAVYFFSGLEFSRFFVARLTQAILFGASLAPLTYFVTKHLILFPLSSDEAQEESNMKREQVARAAAWLVAVYPTLLLYPIGLGTENPFLFLLLFSFFFILKTIETPSTSHLLLSGLFLALTALTRSVILPFVGVAILYLFYLHGKKTWLVVVTFVLLISPWVIRNSLLHHKLTGIETSMGYNLYLGYHPQGNGSFVFGPSLDLLTIMDDAERDEIGNQKAWGFIKGQPTRIIPLMLNRFGFFFGLEKRTLVYLYSNNFLGFIPLPLLLIISAILLLPFTIISTSAALGLSLLQCKPQTVMLFLLFVSYLLPHIFILAEDRYHIALIPYFAILAAHFWNNGFQSITARWNESKFGKLAVTFAVLGVFLLLTNWGVELFRDADKIATLLGPNGNNVYYPY
ncbi:MAG: glycosyltransferase family 39 protein [Anaerolineales bacterium]